MQDIESKSISLPRVKWLESSDKTFAVRHFRGQRTVDVIALDEVNHGQAVQFCNADEVLNSHGFNNKIKHLSLLDRLKRMFKR